MTKIQWTNETWNPIVGCSKVSEGCKNCYAEVMARRLSGISMSKDEDPARIEGIGRYPFALNSNGHWNGQTYFDENELQKPFQWKKGRMIFVVSMGDLFHESVSFTWIDKVIDVIRYTKQHTYQVLTKRPERMLEYFTKHVPEKYIMENGNMLDNLWLGVTAENQQRANERIPILLHIPAAKRFVSIEPMLELVDLNIDIDPLSWAGYTKRNLLTGELTNQYRESICADKINHLDWVICGCESGPKRRPMDFDWAVNLRDQCVAANVPFFFKQRYVGNKKIHMPTIDCKVWDQVPEH